MALEITPSSKLLFIGDSITAAGRSKPDGEGRTPEEYGSGYVSQVNALLTATYPGHRIRCVNKGIGGNTVLDLERRWQQDVMDPRPDWLSVMIGINDVWRQHDIPLQTEKHVGIATYEATLRQLLVQSREGLELKGLVLMTPFFIETNQSDAMRAQMDAYGDVVRKLAGETGARLVDTQAAFDRYLQHFHSAQLAWDRVHPNPTGHLLIARAFLDAVGYEWGGE